MGSITFQAVGDASIGTKTKTYAVSDADMNRFAAWTIARFATRPTNGNPTPPALTVAQGLAAWADWVVTMTKTEIVGRERTATVDAVPPTPPFIAT